MIKRKLLFILATILLLATNGYSQKNSSIGIGGTINSVWIIRQNIYGEPELDYLTKAGFQGMLSYCRDFSEKTGMQLEFGYSKQGQKYEGKQYNRYAEREIDLKYLQIPFLLRYTNYKGTVAKLNLKFGPQLGILLEARQEYLRGGVKAENEISSDSTFDVSKQIITERFGRFDLLLVGEAGADIKIAENWFLNIGLRGNFGLTDINAPEYRYRDFSQQYNPSKNFFIGINFGINYVFTRNQPQVSE